MNDNVISISEIQRAENVVITDADIEEMVAEIFTSTSQSSTDVSTVNTDAIVEEAMSNMEDHTSAIPTNSATLLQTENTSRFSSAIWYDKIKDTNILLAGVGGIGSYVAFLLSRMHPKRIVIYDPDVVEEVNMSGQLFNYNQIGTHKVSAVCTTMYSFSMYYGAYTHAERFTENTGTDDIMICGFDNMAARRTFFEAWYKRVKLKPKNERQNCLFIDGRLAAEEFQVFCIKGDDDYNKNRYLKEFLFTDAEADETICSYKQTTFMANMIASVMVNLFTNFVANQCNPIIDRDLPFFTSYVAETMFFKTEA